MDREKVIKEYEDFVNGYECFCSSDDYVYEMHKAVLALLKEQDAVEPKFVRNEWRCGACGHVVLTYCFDINEGEMGKVMANYCPSCGRAVKWNA